MRIEIGKILQISFISAQLQTLFVVSNKLLRIVKMLHKLVFQLRGIRRHYRKYAIGLVGKHDLTIQSDLYYPRFLRPKLSTLYSLVLFDSPQWVFRVRPIKVDTFCWYKNILFFTMEPHDLVDACHGYHDI